MTLDNLLEENEIGEDFDLLVVDVEGIEEQVFRGFKINRWKPKMMIVELCDTHPDLATTSSNDSKLLGKIPANNYVTIYKDSINTILVRHDVRKHVYKSSA